MPKLMIDFVTSLDGYGAAEGWPGLWGLGGPEYLAWLEDQPEADYTVLMGANTYRLMSQLAAEGEPGTEELAGDVQDRLLEHADRASCLAEQPADLRGGRRCGAHAEGREARNRCARSAA